MADFPWFLFDPVGRMVRPPGDGDHISPEVSQQTAEKMKEMVRKCPIYLRPPTTTNKKWITKK